jgi:hypothetical protein
MWDALPIQRRQRTTTTSASSDFSRIDPDAKYAKTPKDAGVCCSRWRDVDPGVQRWALNLWILNFGIQRCPLGPDDFFVWIPFVSTLAAKLGRWTSESAAAAAVIMCNFVDPAYRGRGAVEKMILTVARALYNAGNPIPFFELQNVPASMADATPFMRFSYVWIPTLLPGSAAEWVETADIDCSNIPGFHPSTWDGYRMFRHASRRILVDPHDDIVWYDSIADVVTARVPVSSKYVRWFSPYGNIRVYALNVRFAPDETRSGLC